MYNMKTKTKTMKSSRTDRLTLFLNWTWTYKATTFLCEQMRKREREKKIEFWVTKKPHGEKALRLNFGWFLYGHFPHTDRLMFHVSLLFAQLNHVFSRCTTTSALLFEFHWSGHWFGCEDFFAAHTFSLLFWLDRFLWARPRDIPDRHYCCVTGENHGHSHKMFIHRIKRKKLCKNPSNAQWMMV